VITADQGVAFTNQVDVLSLAFIGNVPAGKCAGAVLPTVPGHFR
jgi:hypothetical protein